MKHSAVPTGNKFYNKYSNFVEYSYKGHKYEVEYPNDNSYSVSSPKVQHEDAQRAIDRLIANENKSEKESAEVGLDTFFKSIGL